MALVLCGVLFTSVSLNWQPAANGTPTQAQILHALNRLSFGPTVGDVQQVQKMGLEAYIQGQLNPETLSDPPKLTQTLAKLPTLKLTANQLFKQYNLPKQKDGRKPSDEELKKLRQRSNQPLQQAIQARLLRSVTSSRQLQEVMVDFWFNHFNVYARKAHNRFWTGSYEIEAIRPHALGKFRDLLEATARHPAMLVYLDNWQNSAPGSPGARGRFKGLNENYARELMELHTLGVNGGYTQTDVITLAKILTGWGIVRPDKPKGGEFYFDEKRHDFSDKVLLGQAIPGQGVPEVEQALDILASHPSTARHVSYKLAQYFVSDNPPAALVDRMAEQFLASEGDISAVLETLFQSDEFWDPQYYGQKFKTPYQYIVSLLRATGTTDIPTKQVAGWLRQMGMPPYECITPDGYKNTEEAWLSPDAVQRRISLALSISRGHFKRKQPVDVNQLSQTLKGLLSPQTLEVINNNPKNLKVGLMLGSPEMMQR